MKFTKTILENGLRVVTVPVKDNPAVTVLVMVEAGSKYETKEINGLSHFLEHVMFKGTKKRPKATDISRELDELGAHYNAFTSQEYTGYYAKVGSRHLDKALEIVSDMYLNPVFDSAEIEKEKGVIIEEIKMYNDLPQEHVHDVLAEIMFPGQPAGWSVLGTEGNIRSFSRDNFIDYRKKHYVASATTVIVSGNIDEDETLKKIKASFASISENQKSSKISVKESQTKPEMALVHKTTDQTHLVIAVRTFPVTDKRIPVMKVLTTILGRGMSSRLWSKMRDELGICYYIKTSHNPSTDHGDFAVSAGVDNKRVDLAVSAILAELSKIKTEAVSEKELRKAKDHIAGTMMLGLETSDDQAEYAGHQEILKHKIDSPDDILAKVEEVTAEDVMKLANDIFVDDKLNMAMIGPYEDKSRFEKILSFSKANV